MFESDTFTSKVSDGGSSMGGSVVSQPAKSRYAGYGWHKQPIYWHDSFPSFAFFTIAVETTHELSARLAQSSCVPCTGQGDGACLRRSIDMCIVRNSFAKIC